MTVLDGLGHELGVLVVTAHDPEYIIAASDLVVLGTCQQKSMVFTAGTYSEPVVKGLSQTRSVLFEILDSYRG